MLDLFVDCFLAAFGLVLTFSVIYAAIRLWPVTLLLVLAWACVGCGDDSTPHFDYHDANEAQVAQLDCALGLIADRLHNVAGDVWMVESLVARKGGEAIYGRTLGRDDYLSVYLVKIPGLAQVFVHELVHVLAGQETDTRDPAHANPAYFGPDSLAEDLSGRAYVECQHG